jgi:hypothetical protein
MGMRDDELRARQEQQLAALDGLKRVLRERAEIVAARERELNEMRRELARRLDRAQPAGAPPGGDGERALAERERRLVERERELEAALGAAARREHEAEAELALARAERDRLEERARAAHEVERELAGLRIRLEQERAELLSEGTPPQPVPEPAADPDPHPPPAPTPLPTPEDEPELDPAAGADPTATVPTGRPDDDTAELEPRRARARRR